MIQPASIATDSNIDKLKTTKSLEVLLLAREEVSQSFNHSVSWPVNYE